MADAISSRGMMFVGETPWHGKGVKVNEADAYSVDLCIKASGLDWKVSKVPLYTKDGREVPGAFATMRMDDGAIFGTVGDKYTILQNEDAFNFFQPFLDTRQVSIETAGSLYDGSKVWVLAKLANNLQVTFGDEVSKYLLLHHSHDGSSSVGVLGTGVRVVCQNTLRMAKEDGATKVFGKVRHTARMEARLDAARDQLAQANHLFHLTVEKYQFLASKEISDAQRETYFRKVLGVELEGDLPTRSRNRVDRLHELTETSPGAGLAGAKNTFWGAYNGYTYFTSHEYGRTDDARLDSLWFGADDALETALELASA